MARQIYDSFDHEDLKEKMRKNIIAIIPARGGSKRFPGKNIYPLNGKPLIHYTIKAALEEKRIDKVIISTNSLKIAKISKDEGAEVPFLRPRHLSGADSSVIDALIYTVKRLEKDRKYHADYILLLQPTNPLVDSRQISKAIDLLFTNNADSVVSVVELDTPSHPYNVRTVDKNGRMKFWLEDLHYKDIGKRRPPFYKAANLWLTSFDTLIRDRRIEGKKNYALLVDSISALDIDYKNDMELIEAWMQYKVGQGR